jgi:hypothetical protein
VPHGPVPKRSTQRRHRIKRDITHAPTEDEVVIPEPDEEWHRIAKQWYASLQRSGQRQFYESSDWAQAYYVAEVMSWSLTAGITGSLFSAVISASAELLTTEGARRRMRLELERAHAEGEATVSDAMADYKKMAAVS